MWLLSVTGFAEMRQVRDFAIVCLNIFVMCASLGITYPLLSVILEQRGISSTVIGLNASTLAIAMFIMSPFVGRVVARFGIRPTLYASLAGTMACIFLFKLFDNMAAWFVLRFVMGTCEAFIFVITEIWINKTAPDKTRGRLISLYGTSIASGFLIGSWVVLAAGFDGWLPFILGIGILAIALFPAGMIREIRFTEIEDKPSAFLSTFKNHPTELWGAFAFGAIETGMFSMIVIYGLYNGLSEREATILMMVLVIGNISLQFPLGILADKMKKIAMLLLVTSLSALGCLLLPLIILKPVFVYPVLFAIGGMVIAIYNVSLSIVGEHAKGADLVNANAAMASLYGLGAAVSPALIGYSMQIVDPHGYAYAVTLILGTYAVYLVVQFIRAKIAITNIAPQAAAPGTTPDIDFPAKNRQSETNLET